MLLCQWLFIYCFECNTLRFLDLDNQKEFFLNLFFAIGYQFLIMNALTSQPRNPEIVARRCSIKTLFLKILQNSQEKNVLESLFNKVAFLQVWNLIKKWLQRRCFSLNFAKNFKNTFFHNKLRCLFLKIPPPKKEQPAETYFWYA